MPGGVKATAVMAAVALIAGGNIAAKHRQQDRERAAADRVDATLLAAGGSPADKEFELTIVVANRGDRPITVTGPLRVEPPAYDVLSSPDHAVAAGANQRVDVRFRARCPGPAVAAGRPVRLVLPIAASSGRVRDVATDIDDHQLWDLSRQACGYLPLGESLLSSVRDVTGSRYAVRFTLELQNRSARSVVLVDVTSPGLALSPRGGVPVLIQPGTPVGLAMTASLPACSRLPVFGPPSRAGALRFGTLSLELRDAAGATATMPYALGAEGEALSLLTELFALRNRICPGAGGPTGTGRPRFS